MSRDVWTKKSALIFALALATTPAFAHAVVATEVVATEVSTGVEFYEGT